ncbi:nucleoside diphosphate kinase homolog 5-like [Amphibalanus amphitrite]|uniref:nucleoside diphosphate kinase homolog 5-like n=1 Tax=Amphibalanus amphitrite TaxID=1232801 RepID=UPI001C90D89E|nr:nucleoside diphosphate kinase homolog 5-like [Amphibalanus amphitrite]XP_043197329.1 nucleoside diphosphate kinase homolog 5-like [Amphibalanus amphitrite]XP_043197338.1 nucleoside diphosphate kinase homolog 5-like [Amphibalanus amphitrite]XP_043197345.1 nucleoside diphosphate kinase homolog 5-like [Amphibalanus amphitrite]XP_043197353.1 nucleoside diphosphate kinase homolog 5-like [Amphibalanus amphitrite]XP_043197358.1 nucleoside diphosphate kinase homolog 5-like [Amphibalanus amphitrite]
MEKTLAIIKPNAIANAEEIEKMIIKDGFTIVQRRRVLLSKEQTMEFYAEHRDKPFFSDLINFMTSGPVLAMVLSKDRAVRAWRRLLGPTSVAAAIKKHPDSIRARFGSSDTENAAHGSDSAESAEREIRFFFPDVTLYPILSGMEARDFVDDYVSETLVRGLTELCKTKPADPVSWLAEWLLNNNPYQPVQGVH